MNSAIAGQRLHNQCVIGRAYRQPADVVGWLGAVQAQEYPAARWALALRMSDRTTDAQVERAFDAGLIWWRIAIATRCLTARPALCRAPAEP